MAELAPLALYVFGAVVFSVLTAFYWRGRRDRRWSALARFTVGCAAAFIVNLLCEFVYLPGVTAAREITTGLVAPLLLDVASEGRSRAWRVTVRVSFAVAVAAATLRALNVFALYRAPAALLAICASAGVAALLLSRRRSRADWICAAALAAVGACAIAGQAPDYFVLAFYAVTLYYRERLAFFDVFVKLGAFAGIGIATVSLLTESSWQTAAALFAAWIAGAALYPIVSRAIDRLWLRRPFSPAGAERRFLRDVQGATGDRDLAARAAASLSAIFQTRAEVSLEDAQPAISLAPRPDGIPFLSDDRRLLDSLTGALAVMLENVRFREREHQLRTLATRAELKALRAQINPHFLFNSLSVIAGLIESQPRLADETIEHLAHVFRYTLRKSEDEWTPLAEEIEFVRAYLRIEQARFGDRLQTAITVTPEAAAVPIPAMCVQPLVENAIRHGLSVAPGPGRVSVAAAAADGELRIEIADTGPGFPPHFDVAKTAEGHGMRNVADRLRGYYGDAARLSCEGDSRGARVTLSLPCAPARMGSVCA